MQIVKYIYQPGFNDLIAIVKWKYDIILKSIIDRIGAWIKNHYIETCLFLPMQVYGNYNQVIMQTFYPL